MTDFENELLSVLKEINASLKSLGLNDASTNLGAIELLAMEVKNLGESYKDLNG